MAGNKFIALLRIQEVTQSPSNKKKNWEKTPHICELFDYPHFYNCTNFHDSVHAFSHFQGIPDVYISITSGIVLFVHTICNHLVHSSRISPIFSYSNESQNECVNKNISFI